MIKCTVLILVCLVCSPVCSSHYRENTGLSPVIAQWAESKSKSPKLFFLGGGGIFEIIFVIIFLYFFSEMFWTFCTFCSGFTKSLPKDYELSRRRTQQAQFEQWRDYKSWIRNQKSKSKSILLPKKDQIYLLQEKMRLNYVNSMAQMHLMRQNDGFDLQRMQSSAELKSVIFNKIDEIQHPKNCLDAKMLICLGKV
jgi:hypothetical protein